MFVRITLKVIITLISLLGALGLASEEPISTPNIDSVEAEQPSKTVALDSVVDELQEPATKIAAKGPLEILEFVLTNKIEGREPKEIVETFNQEDTGMAYAFARLSTERHTQVTFVWFREGREHTRFTTNVQAAKKWRTYSSTKLRPGNWKVQLVSNGEVLAERMFTVQ